MRNDIFVKGFFTGCLLQLAIGPVFFVILNTALLYGIKNGLFAVLGVTIVDYLYILLAIYGTGKLLKSRKTKRTLTIISSTVVALFGIMLLKKGVVLHTTDLAELYPMSPVQSFASTFLLTIASPLTVLFWTSIFTSKSIEYALHKSDLLVFGLSAGFATVVFLGATVLLCSPLNCVVPVSLIRIVNGGVGLLLIVFAVTRVVKGLKKNP